MSLPFLESSTKYEEYDKYAYYLWNDLWNKGTVKFFRLQRLLIDLHTFTANVLFDPKVGLNFIYFVFFRLQGAISLDVG